MWVICRSEVGVASRIIVDRQIRPTIRLNIARIGQVMRDLMRTSPDHDLYHVGIWGVDDIVLDTTVIG